MDKTQKQQYIDISPVLFHNDDPYIAHLNNKKKIHVHYNPNPHSNILSTQFQKKFYQLHIMGRYML